MHAMAASPLKDLKITIHTTTTIYPSEPTMRRTMFLSNIDQLLNFHVEAVQFFSPNPDHPFESVVERLRSAGERLLVEYDFLAGRLQFGEDGRLEIDCNAAGISFAVASSELSLEELGELYPNPVFRQLTPMPELSDDEPICDFQVTQFKCGGFALGGSVNHSAMDAPSYYIFFLNLANLTCTNKPLAIKPFSDRKLLAARSPPRVTFPHPDLVKLEDMELPLTLLNPNPNTTLQFKLFHLDSSHISSLKEKAARGAGPVSPKLVTSFNVVAAHLWRCKALAAAAAAAAAPDVELNNKTSTLLYSVDIRQKLEPNLPLSYAGNAVLTAYARATLRELGAGGSFARIVQRVREGTARMSDEYIRSVIDWGQIYKGYPNGDVFLTSWWKLGFAGMEYEWGQPRYFCPLPHPGRELIMLFPREGEGVNALVGLPEGAVMNKFQNLFHSFLSQPRL